MMGRYFPHIFFQTGDNDTLGDIPLILGYGSKSGELLGDHATEQEWREDYEEQILAWQRTGALRQQFLGMRKVEEANHLSLVTYQEHAEAVSEMVDELISVVRLEHGTAQR